MKYLDILEDSGDLICTLGISEELLADRFARTVELLFTQEHINEGIRGYIYDLVHVLSPELYVFVMSSNIEEEPKIEKLEFEISSKFEEIPHIHQSHIYCRLENLLLDKESKEDLLNQLVDVVNVFITTDLFASVFDRSISLLESEMLIECVMESDENEDDFEFSDEEEDTTDFRILH